MTQLAKTDQNNGAVADYAGGILAVIERAARDPNVDIDKMERLLAMQERVRERDAIVAFNEALSDLQPKLPVITERGKIIVRAKSANGQRDGEITQETAYALWEDINEAIRPLLHEHGFALTFKTGQAPDGKLLVTGILKHRMGHQEEAALPLPHDSSGSKNAVQAIGSSLSYGKRYAAMQLLNITTRGEDDNALQASPAVVHEKPADAPFPQGPAGNKTALKAMGRNVWRDIEGSGDADQLDVVLSDNRDVLRQLKEALPSWWTGYSKDGEQHDGLEAVIARKRAEFGDAR